MADVFPSPAMPGIDTEDFTFPHQPPSPHSLKHVQHTNLDSFSSPPAPPLQDHNYNFSNIVYDESSASNTDHEVEYRDDEDGTLLRAGGAGAATTSSRSSISSLPDSVMPNAYAEEEVQMQDTPTKSPRVLLHHRSGSLGYKIKSPAHGVPAVREYGNREYSPAFRNPSSVRAMQMRDEEPCEDDGGPRPLSGHRRRGSRMSVLSHRSGNSTQTSPTKRKSSPLKSAIKTEFPLVLLHCTLLPPTLGALTLPLHGKLSPGDEEALLKEVLPELYWRRWRVLREKVVGNVEVRTRGVLIGHPREEYEMLEERLLESLELEGARVREGHFRGNEDEDEESGDDEQVENPLKTKCPDCGKKVAVGAELERKWEVKVYAANGLMRAGAWSAAWGEMEKVDVEVGVWLPEHVRREVEERLAELGFGEHEEEFPREHDVEAETEEERRRREVYGMDDEDGASQDKVDGLYEEVNHSQPGPSRHEQHTVHQHPHQQHEISLQDLILNHLKAIAQDRRNVFIAFLSILVLFYAMSNPNATSGQGLVPLTPIHTASDSAQVEFVTMTVTSTAVSVSTTTVVESAATSLVPPPEPRRIARNSTTAEPATIRVEEVPKSEAEVPAPVELEQEQQQEEEQETPSVAEIVVDMLVGDGDALLE